MLWLGRIFVVALYGILALHVFAFIAYIINPLIKVIGIVYTLSWGCIGLILVYNIVFNHFLSMVIKPGGPKEMRIDEELRQ